MDQESINVKYTYLEHRGGVFSENELIINVHYRVAHSLIFDIGTKYNAKLISLLTKHIKYYEALNHHVATSVEIISISYMKERENNL